MTFCVWLLSASVNAQQPLLLVTEIYPPYQALDAKDQLTGIATERVKLIFNEAGLTHQIKFLPWARAYQQALLQPDVFIFSMMKLPARANSFTWLVPLCEVNVSFYKLKGRDDISINSIEQAKNYRIGVGRDQGNAVFLQEQGFAINEQLIIVNNNEQLRKMLVHKRIDLLLTTDEYIQEIIKNKQLYAAMLESEFTVDSLKRTLYLAANKATSAELTNKIINAYQRLPPSLFGQCIQ